MILEIDWQGARQVRAAQPDCTTVFILPPSRRELEARLRNRKTDSDEVIARRLRDCIADMSHYAEFDSVIVNDDFERAVRELLDILRGSQDYGSGRAVAEATGGGPAGLTTRSGAAGLRETAPESAANPGKTT